MSETHPLLRMIMNSPKARLNTMVANRERRHSPEWWRGYRQARMRINLHVFLARLSNQGSEE